MNSCVFFFLGKRLPWLSICHCCSLYFRFEFMWYSTCLTNFGFGIWRSTCSFLWAPNLKVFNFRFVGVYIFKNSLFDFPFLETTFRFVHFSTFPFRMPTFPYFYFSTFPFLVTTFLVCLACCSGIKVTSLRDSAYSFDRAS